MTLVASGKSERKFELAPQGVHQMVCVDVVDLGIVENQRYNTKQHKCRIVWQVNERMTDGRRYLISRFFTVSLSENSALRPFLEMWRNQAFTQAEIDNGFDLDKLVGVNGMGQILHQQKDENTYANVSAMLPLTKGLQKIEPEDYTRVRDREPSQTISPPQAKAATAPEPSGIRPVNTIVEEDEIPF